MERIGFIEKLRDIAVHDGNRTALVYDNGVLSLSYAELDRLSDALAKKIRRSGIGPGDATAVMMRRNALSIAAEIGVLKAGAVFVPVVPSYPKERIDTILKDCGAKLLLDEAFFADLPPCPPAFEPVPPREDMAMLIYTSGSTGRPKGVVYDPAAYNATVRRLTSHFEGIGPVILCSFAPMAFVAHLFEFAAVFDHGGTTHIITDEIRMDPIKLEGYYRRHRISVGFVSPKLFSLFKKDLPDFKKIVLGGEKVSLFDPRGYNVVVSYAQTEAMDILRYRVDAPRKEAIIGRPVPDTEVFLLDAQGHDAGIGSEGEICAKGVYPRRYLHLPEESKKTFTPTEDGEVLVHTGDIGIRHENGNIEYINRRDFMVKINGNRVDPSEIESAMKQLPAVEDAVVKAFTESDGRAYLCCYYVSPETFEPRKIKALLAKTLPPYMLPRRFVRLGSLPKNANGKTDRNALKEPDGTQTEKTYVAPVSDGEKKLCRIVEKLLNIKTAGMTDDFFELGASSLHAASLVSTLEQEGMGIIEVKQVYAHPVLNDLMQCILKSGLIGNTDYTVLSKGEAGYPPLFFFHTANMGTESYRSLIGALPPEFPFMGFENHNLNYPDVPVTSVQSLVKYYQLIGSDFYDRSDRNETEAKIFGGWSFGGTLAFEAALTAEKAGERVAGVILLDPLLVEEKDRKRVTEGAADPNLKKYFEEETLFSDTKKETDANRMFENNKLVARMLAGYEPAGKLACPVLFIKAGTVRTTGTVKALCHKYPANGYEKYCENIRIVSMDCDHDALGNNEEALRLVRGFVLERKPDEK